MAPFAPFLAEHLYLELSKLGGREPGPASVHLCDYPESEDDLVQPELELAVDRMQQVVLLGRQRREERKVGLRTPLRCLTIINRDTALLQELERLEGYVKSELNVQRVRYEADEAAYIELVARPNFPLLGKRLGRRMKEFHAAISSLTAGQIAQLQENGRLEVAGEMFDLEEIQVEQRARQGTSTVSNRFIALDLDCHLDDSLERAGYAREIVNRIQQRRKEMALNVADRIEVRHRGDPELQKAALEHADYIAEATLAVSFEQGGDGGVTAEIDGREFVFEVTKA